VCANFSVTLFIKARKPPPQIQLASGAGWSERRFLGIAHGLLHWRHSAILRQLLIFRAGIFVDWGEKYRRERCESCSSAFHCASRRCASELHRVVRWRDRLWMIDAFLWHVCVACQNNPEPDQVVQGLFKCFVSGYDVEKKKVVAKPGPGVKHISGFNVLNNHAVNFISCFVSAIWTPVSYSYVAGFLENFRWRLASVHRPFLSSMIV